MLYIDKDLVEKSKEFGFNLSKTFENHLKQLITQFPTCNSVNNLDSLSNYAGWCGRRDLNPGRQRGRLMSCRTRLRPHVFDCIRLGSLSLWSWIFVVDAWPSLQISALLADREDPCLRNKVFNASKFSILQYVTCGFLESLSVCLSSVSVIMVVVGVVLGWD